jgi:hypothetical protein
MSALERTRPESCLSDLRIDRLLRGELGEASAAEARAHADACAACTARMHAIELERTMFQASPPSPAWTDVASSKSGPARTADRAAPRPKRAWTLRAASVTTAVALAAAVMLVLRTRQFAPQEEGTRTKGATSVDWVVEHAGAVRGITDGDVVQAGDRVQARVTSGVPLEVAVTESDGTGAAKVLYPDARGRGSPIAAGSQVPLPISFELDDAPGPERFMIVTCPAGTDPVPAARAIVASREAMEAPGCKRHAITLEKRAP